MAAFLAMAAEVKDQALRGEELMKKGQYEQAIAIFEKIAQTSQTFEGIIEVKFDLAWCYYHRHKYDKAIPLFTELSTERAPDKNMREQSAFLLGECYARLAALQTGKEQEKERRKNVAKAVEIQTDFLRKYAKSQWCPYAQYGRAYAYFLDNDLEQARADLEILARGRTAISESACFLIGSVYSQQALQLIKSGKKDEAKPYLDKARAEFDKLSKSKANLEMANNSDYSLAETWFEAEQYPEAIQYFRDVRPKADVLKDLKERQEAYKKMQAEAIRKRENYQIIKKELEGVTGKYMDVLAAPDLMIMAYIRMADAYLRMKRYSEVVTICDHLLKFAPTNQYQQVALLAINSYLALAQKESSPKDVDAAAGIYEELKARPGGSSTNVQRVALSIGQVYYLQKNTGTALQYFAESIEAFPDGTGIEDALYLKAACEYDLNQLDDLRETADAYMEKFPKGNFTPNLLYYKAVGLSKAKESEEALSSINELLKRYPTGTETFDQMDAALYMKGDILIQLKKTAEAIALYEDFIKRYKESPLKPYASFQMGRALAEAGQSARAVAVLEQVIRDNPQKDIAVQALRQIAYVYQLKNDFVNMFHTLERLPMEFPQSEDVPETCFLLGWVAKEKLGDYDTAVKYFWQSLEDAPQQKRAPEILFLIAQALCQKAEKLGHPIVISDAQKAVYKEAFLESASVCEILLQNYPSSEFASAAISHIADTIFNLVRFRMLKIEDALQYFGKAIARHEDDSCLKAQFIFAKGMFLMKNAENEKTEKEKALAVFKEAFAADPNVKLSAQMLLDYADACKEASALQEAQEMYQRVMMEFSSADPQSAAQASFGLADILFEDGKDTEAEEAYKNVLKKYPWYAKGKQGKVKIAQIRERKKDYEAAERMYTDVAMHAKDEGTPRETTLAAILGVIRCQLIQAEQYDKQGNRTQALEKFKAADANVTKIIVMFEAYPDAVAEALFCKGKIYEMQKNYDKAREQYEKLTREYKKYSWAKMAEERLAILPKAAGGK
jgi:tetratricopeptide (TPR) repeat protein